MTSTVLPTAVGSATDRPPGGASAADGRPTVVVPARPRRGSDFARLSELVLAAGLLRRRRLAYSALILGTLLLLIATVATMVIIGDSWWQLLTAVALGVVFTQIAFLGHDGGHRQVFASHQANDLLGRVTGALVGLSFGWWVGKHNRHHANPNKECHDPDIGDGVLAFTTTQIAARTGGFGRVIARRQAWLFFPLLTLEGLNLHASSVRALLPGAERSGRGGRRSAEALCLLAHLMVYLTGLLLIMSPLKVVAFVVIHQAVFGLYMGCSFAPNHKGMPVLPADSELDYLRRQVLTSRNVRGGRLTDWALGGLNYQIEHHLFPSMPRASLRHVQPLVRAFCAASGVSYAETSILGSYRAALCHLNELGAPLRADDKT